MVLEDPKTGKEVFVHRTAAAFVKYGTKLRCGGAWYVNHEQDIRWWQDLARLETVK